MLSFQGDVVIARSLAMYGEWAEHELSYLRPYIIPGQVVIDVGANIGTHTLPFSKWVRSGEVIAIEAQTDVSAVLSVNCIINERTNVKIVNAVCSEYSGWYSGQGICRDLTNPGAVSFRLQRNHERRFSFWRNKAIPSDAIPAIRLDDLVIPEKRACLIKLDIEGMEIGALKGGRRLLSEHSPVLFMEQLDTQQIPELFRILKPLGYQLYWVETHPFNQDNFRGETENIWWRTETAILGAPPGKDPVALAPVRLDDRQPPALLDARAGAYVSHCVSS